MYQPPPAILHPLRFLYPVAGIPVGNLFGTTLVGRVSRVIAGQLPAEVEVSLLRGIPGIPTATPGIVHRSSSLSSIYIVGCG